MDGESIRVTRSVVLPLAEIELPLLALERAGRPARAEVGDARRGGLRRRGLEALTDAQKRRVVAQAGPVLRAVAQDERSQLRNRELAVERLVEQLREALQVEPPACPTKPTAASRERRLEDEAPPLRDEAAPSRPGRLSPENYSGLTLVGVALANGLAIGVMVSAVGHISGGHFNPAVTLGFLITRRIAPSLAVTYWSIQFAAAAAAAALLRWLFPAGARQITHLGAPASRAASASGRDSCSRS